MAERIYFERYINVYRFMDVVEKRPNNDQFGTASMDNGPWSGTETWEEAMNQFQNGIPEQAEKLQKSLNAFKANSNISSPKNRPKNHYYGYSPNVAAAIIGLPKSMRYNERQPQKVKAIRILYDMTQNCGTDADTLRKAGETVLQLVYLLECRGYRVALDGLAFNGERDERRFILAINLKEWKQHLDIMKLSFPLTSPAMFRRFGFKWAETLPEVSSRVSGYGRHIEKGESLRLCGKCGIDTKQAYFIGVDDCDENAFDAFKLAKSLGIIT